MSYIFQLLLTHNEKPGVCKVIHDGILKTALLCRDYQRLRRTSSYTLTPKAAAFLPSTQCGVYGASADALLLWVQVMSDVRRAINKRNTEN